VLADRFVFVNRSFRHTHVNDSLDRAIKDWQAGPLAELCAKQGKYWFAAKAPSAISSNRAPNVALCRTFQEHFVAHNALNRLQHQLQNRRAVGPGVEARLLQVTNAGGTMRTAVVREQRSGRISYETGTYVDKLAQLGGRPKAAAQRVDGHAEAVRVQYVDLKEFELRTRTPMKDSIQKC